MSALAEPWESDVALHHWVHRLLVYVLDHGPTDEDTLRRHCLRPDEIAGYVPDVQQDLNAVAMLDGLIDYLDRKGRSDLFTRALRRWQSSADEVRRTLRWDDLPPAVVQLSHRRAAVLLEHCRGKSWIERHADGILWQLTESGLDAVDRMWTDGVR